jgi:hypothetical protein
MSLWQRSFGSLRATTRHDLKSQWLRPNAYAAEEKFHWRPVASTLFRNKPFGENGEGLSYCGAKSCAVECAVR